MALIDSTSTTPSSLGPASVATATPDAAKLRRLAGQFEAQMLAHMMREMQETSFDDGEKTGFDSGPLGDTINAELGLALSRAGGVGLGDLLGRALTRQMTTTSGTNAPTAPMTQPPAIQGPSDSGADAAPVAPQSDAQAAAGIVAAPAGRVTSAFGWRQDPIDGSARFHSGTDIAMPVGSPVASAGDGRVVFVGERSGYGLTVEVAHADGRQTRYAHLSAAEVQVGDSVSKGEPIAKSGNSGRSTGPHLHFEVLQNGQAVAPEHQ